MKLSVLSPDEIPQIFVFEIIFHVLLLPSDNRGEHHMKLSKTAALVVAILLSGCASTLNVLDNVRIGQSETQVRESVRATPTWTFENEKAKFIVYGFIATFLDMYDNTITYYFVKLEDGKVVKKGMLRKRERNEIKMIDPDFDTNKLIRQPHGRPKRTPASSYLLPDEVVFAV